MKRSILISLALAAPMLSGCLSMVSEDDLRAALVRPCENPRDASPWLLADKWEDGDTYSPETRFRSDGVLIYGYDGSSYDNGRWALSGNHLHMDTNEHYADYDGVFDGERGSGEMKNKPGNIGKWNLERDCKG